MLRLSSFCSGSSFVPTGDLHRSGAVVYCADGRKKHPNTYRSGMAGGGNACLLVCHANRKALSSCTPAFFTLQIPDDMIRQFPTYKGCPSVRPCLPDAACTAATLHAGQLPDIPIVAGKPETPRSTVVSAYLRRRIARVVPASFTNGSSPNHTMD